MPIFLSLMTIFSLTSFVVHAKDAGGVAHSICEDTKDLKPGDWLILDLDGTTITEGQVLGQDQWHQLAVQRVMEGAVVGRDEAAAVLRPLTVAIKRASRLVLVEECMPKRVRQLQDAGVSVFAVTGRAPRFATETLKHLARLGIDFTRSATPAQFTSLKWDGEDVVFKGGVFFDGGLEKGFLLQVLVDAVPVRPGHIRIYDDQESNIRIYDLIISRLKLSARAVHFIPEPWLREQDQMAIADVQRRDFVRRGNTGPIMSDAEAARRVKCVRALSTVTSPK